MLRLVIFTASLAVIADAQGRPKPATVKIISPANGVVVHSGQTIEIEVAVTGPYSVVGISESLGVLIGLGRSLDVTPYLFRIQIPARVNPKPYTITATLYDFGGRINSTIATDSIKLDVEPSAPPRKLRISPDGPLILPIGDARDLSVSGTFDGPDELNLNSSTLTTYQADPSGIVSVAWGQVRALATGSAKITVRHQGLESSVTVRVTGDELRITTPTEGTVVHPGQEFSVDVSAVGGPFKGVLVFLAPDFRTVANSAVQPYWFSLTVPASAKIGPADIVAMGNTDASHLFSSPVTIDVERTDPPQSIFTSVDKYGASTWVGGYGRIYVYGKYSDDPFVDLTRSTLTTYETSSEGIISMAVNGEFTGLATGSTAVVIRHRNLSITVKVVVRE